MATHGDYSTLGGYSCPRAAFAERHGDGLAGQGTEEVFWYGARFDSLFVGMGIADQSRKLGGGEIGYGEEMARCER